MGSRVRTPLVLAGALLAVGVFVSALERLLPARQPTAQATAPTSRPEAVPTEVREEDDGTIVIQQGWSERRIQIDESHKRRAFLECIRTGIARDLSEAPHPPSAPGDSVEPRSFWGPGREARRRLDTLLEGCLHETAGIPPADPRTLTTPRD